MGQFHDYRFPGESDEYRAARDRLIEAEIALRRHVEDVAALRRQLPPGGRLKEDYEFDEARVDDRPVKKTRFSELFEGDKDSLVIYNFMYAPGAAAPCPMCTSFVDSLVGAAPHLTQKANLAVIAKATIDELRSFARSRDWKGLRLLSSRHNSFNADYNAERDDEGQMPVLSVFRRDGDGIRHFYSTELLYVAPDPGQNPRHIDMMWPLWNLLDMVPEGRGADWFPSVSYAKAG